MRRLIARLMKKSSHDANVQTDAVEFATTESEKYELTGTATPVRPTANLLALPTQTETVL
jgi:hypothetical protein